MSERIHRFCQWVKYIDRKPSVLGEEERKILVKNYPLNGRATFIYYSNYSGFFSRYDEDEKGMCLDRCELQDLEWLEEIDVAVIDGKICVIRQI